VLSALGQGQRPSDIARNLQVSRMWVYSVKRRWLDEGRSSSLPMGGHRRSRIAHLQAQIGSWIEASPDLTLSELCQRIAEEDVSIKESALWHQLNKWGLSCKKNADRQRTQASARATGAQSMAGRPKRSG
jgi:transposase